MREPSEPLPWAQIMAFGFGKLGLSPEAFWSMSLREMNAAIRWHMPHMNGGTAMNRKGLSALMDLFPDQSLGDPSGQ